MRIHERPRSTDDTIFAPTRQGRSAPPTAVAGAATSALQSKNIRSLPINCPFYRKFLTEQGIFSLLPHHRTCRLAYGGSVSYLILFQRFCSLLSNSLRLPAFCLIYVSSTLHIGFKQDIFYMRFRTVQPFPSFHLDTYGFC